MEFLYFLENLRTPFLDGVFSLITHLGEETFFIILGLFVFWCVNKKEGYYLLTVGFVGTIFNQFLKLWFRIPRPWIKDSSFTIVEAARNQATGYSFPSGHTQSSVGVWGALARWNKNLPFRIICIALCVLVPFSRMYLGVHTPMDVLVSVLIALILIFGIYPVFHKQFESKRAMRIIFSSMVLLSVIFLIFVSFYDFPKDIDINNLKSGIKNAYKLLGCTVGVFISYEFNEKFNDFETKASVVGQILKFVIGIIPVIIIKEGMKPVLSCIFGEWYIKDSIRYFILVLFAGCIWPLTFGWFSKLFKAKK